MLPPDVIGRRARDYHMGRGLNRIRVGGLIQSKCRASAVTPFTLLPCPLTERVRLLEVT